MVKSMIAPLEKNLVPLNNFLRNEYVTAVVALFVVLYASNVAPRLPDFVTDLFNNPIFRVFILFLVAYVANKNPAIALLVSVAFVVTLNVINRQEAEEGFLDVIDTFNGSGNVERFSDATPSCQLSGDWSTTCKSTYEKEKKSSEDKSMLGKCCGCMASELDCTPESTDENCKLFDKHCESAGEEAEEYKYRS